MADELRIVGECHEWQRGRQRDGYGVMKVGRRTMLAHRVAWEAVNGPIPAGMVIRHLCNNVLCCNPAHLALGTHADNKRDSMALKRHRWNTYHGSEHPGAKLTEEQVRAIRSDNRPQAAIARSFGVSQSHVCNIKTRKIWRHI